MSKFQVGDMVRLIGDDPDNENAMRVIHHDVNQWAICFWLDLDLRPHSFALPDEVLERVQ